jgi:hypothetical protein
MSRTNYSQIEREKFQRLVISLRAETGFDHKDFGAIFGVTDSCIYSWEKDLPRPLSRNKKAVERFSTQRKDGVLYLTDEQWDSVVNPDSWIKRPNKPKLPEVKQGVPALVVCMPIVATLILVASIYMYFK